MGLILMVILSSVNMLISGSKRSCAAVLRVERGRLSACLVKGIQELTDEAVTLQIRAGEDTIDTDVPCDLFAFISDHGQPEAYAAGQGEVGVRFSGQLAREIRAISW
jgi:hypothetical protein